MRTILKSFYWVYGPSLSFLALIDLAVQENWVLSRKWFVPYTVIGRLILSVGYHKKRIQLISQQASHLNSLIQSFYSDYIITTFLNVYYLPPGIEIYSKQQKRSQLENMIIFTTNKKCQWKKSSFTFSEERYLGDGGIHALQAGFCIHCL